MSPARPAVLALLALLAAPVRADESRSAFLRAGAAVKAGRYDEAVEDYARAEQLASAPAAKAGAANGAGFVFLKLRRYAEAIPHFERAVAADPRQKLAWNNLGVCHLRRYESGASGTASLDAALAAFHAAAELDAAFHPENLEAARDAAQREAACAGFSATLTGAPDPTGTFISYRIAGEAAEAVCAFEAARANYERAEASAPTRKGKCEGANLLGLLALRTRAPQAAVDHFRRAVATDPANKYAWNNLGVALMRLYNGGTGGRELVEQAVDAFGHVAALDPDYKTDNLAWSRGVLTDLGGPAVSATAMATSGTLSADSAPPPAAGTSKTPAPTGVGTSKTPAPAP